MLVHLVRKKSLESSLSRIAKRVAASFFDLVSVSKEKASLPEGWEEGKLPFCKSIPRVLPGCPESSSSQGAFANYSAAPAAVRRSSTSCEKRAPPARTMQSQEVVALSKEKEASIELWIALCKKHILYTHASTLSVETTTKDRFHYLHFPMRHPPLLPDAR